MNDREESYSDQMAQILDNQQMRMRLKKTNSHKRNPFRKEGRSSCDRSLILTLELQRDSRTWEDRKLVDHFKTDPIEIENIISVVGIDQGQLCLE